MAAQLETQKDRLVIAIDYGTTHTAVAFSTQAGVRASLDEIQVINDWGQQMYNFDKIPSVISYSPSVADEEQWGASLSPTAIQMVNTKLQLEVGHMSMELESVLQALDGMNDLNFQHVEDAQGLPGYPWKGPQEIVRDYLAKVLKHVYSILRRKEILSTMIPIDFVVTMPANWSYTASNTLFRAFNLAGFNRSLFPSMRDMLLVSEFQAAAIYSVRCMKEQVGKDDIKRGDCFILCDAGGAVVDTISYRVKELQPDFRIESITLATGRRCGSMYIDQAFKKWLRDLLGEENYRELDQVHLANKTTSSDTKGMRELMKQFDIFKKRFNSNTRDMRMELPRPLHNLSIRNRVELGEIIVTNNDMKSFFEPFLNDVIELIDNQVDLVERLGRRMRNVLLVGGFAESNYLQESISFSLGLRRFQLLTPDHSWTAVVRGAVILGIEKPIRNDVSTMSPSPQSYGVAVSEPFSETRHNNLDFFTDQLTGTSMAKGQLEWLIKKGDLVLSDKPRVAAGWFTMNFSERSPRKGSVPIYAYDGDEIPMRYYRASQELSSIHTLDFDLMDVPLKEFTRRQAPTGRPFYVASLYLTMRQELQKLEVELRWKNRLLCKASLALL